MRREFCLDQNSKSRISFGTPDHFMRREFCLDQNSKSRISFGTPDLGGPVDVVARRLLGCVLWTDFGGRTAVRITEVEAYGGHDDPASHAFRGRTPRNGSMFESAGTLYVYRSYGIHWCANVAVGRQGDGQAVLVRGGVVTDGHSTVLQRRGRADHLTDGPGKLTQALGITGRTRRHGHHRRARADRTRLASRR